VAGDGYNNTTGRSEALLWTGPIPTPRTCDYNFNQDENTDMIDAQLDTPVLTRAIEPHLRQDSPPKSI